MLIVVLIRVLIGKGHMSIGRRKDVYKGADRDAYGRGDDVYKRMRDAYRKREGSLLFHMRIPLGTLISAPPFSYMHPCGRPYTHLPPFPNKQPYRHLSPFLWASLLASPCLPLSYRNPYRHPSP